MSDLLTQKEIDELMAAIQGGVEVDESDRRHSGSSPKTYDFKTAKRVPRDMIKTIHVIYDTFARLLTTYFNSNLNVICDSAVTSIEEQTFVEFTNAIASSSVLCIIKMPPMLGPGILRLAPDVSYAILECLLGGMNSPSEKRRVLTEIDLNIVEKVVRQILLLNSEAWQKLIKVNTILDSIETSIQFAQIVPPSETIIIVTISVNIGNTESFINFCIPFNAIESISKSINSRLLNSSREIDEETAEENAKNIFNNISEAIVNVSASFSETTISFADLINLQVGDVLQLDHKSDDLIKVDIGHIQRLKGTLGLKDNRYAIRITQIYEEGEAINE